MRILKLALALILIPNARSGDIRASAHVTL